MQHKKHNKAKADNTSVACTDTHRACIDVLSS